MALPAYAVPRALDAPDRFLPGFTLPQFAWTLGGVVAAVACYRLLAPLLPMSVVAWLVVYVPVACALAKRRLWRGWDGLALVLAVVRYAARPKRCVYAPEEE